MDVDEFHFDFCNFWSAFFKDTTTYKCLNNANAEEVAREYNMDHKSNQFYRYEHRSCMVPVLDANERIVDYEITGLADCGNPRELSRFNRNTCAAWMDWSEWSACIVQETVPITDLTKTVHGMGSTF